MCPVGAALSRLSAQGCHTRSPVRCLLHGLRQLMYHFTAVLSPQIGALALETTRDGPGIHSSHTLFSAWRTLTQRVMLWGGGGHRPQSTIRIQRTGEQRWARTPSFLAVASTII